MLTACWPLKEEKQHIAPRVMPVSHSAMISANPFNLKLSAPAHHQAPSRHYFKRGILRLQGTRSTITYLVDMGNVSVLRAIRAVGHTLGFKAAISRMPFHGELLQRTVHETKVGQPTRKDRKQNEILVNRLAPEYTLPQGL